MILVILQIALYVTKALCKNKTFCIEVMSLVASRNSIHFFLIFCNTYLFCNCNVFIAYCGNLLVNVFVIGWPPSSGIYAFGGPPNHRTPLITM